MQDREQQHDVRPGLAQHRELALIDDELLGEDRDRHRGPDRAQVVDRAAEPVRLAQDRDRRRPAGLVRACPGDDVLARATRCCPADGDERLISAIRCRPGAASRSTMGRAAARRQRGVGRHGPPASARGPRGGAPRSRRRRSPRGRLGVRGDGHAGARASDAWPAVAGSASVAAAAAAVSAADPLRAQSTEQLRGQARHRWSGPPVRGRPRSSRPSPPPGTPRRR